MFVLTIPLGLKYFILERYALKQHHLDQGYKETKMGIAPNITQSISHSIQGCLKQYGLKYCLVRTIHTEIGDTLYSTAT